MLRRFAIAGLLVTTASYALFAQRDGFGGYWVTNDFYPDPASGNGGPNTAVIILNVEGSNLSGSITQGQGNPVSITEGRIQGGTATFKASVATGGRVITYTGTLNGNVIVFSRNVLVRDAASRAGWGITGAMGPMEFSVSRDATPPPVFTLLYGTWKQNMQKSTYSPGPAPNFLSPVVTQFVPRRNGAVGMLSTWATATTPGFAEAELRAGVSNLPYYTPDAVQNLVGGNNRRLPTVTTRIIDGRSYEFTLRNPDGVVYQVITDTVSADGKTLAHAVKNINFLGETTSHYVEVLEKQ